MKTFTNNGVTIAYRDEGAGPAIVFLHNGGTSSTIWREQIATLSTTHRTLGIDLPGFGASPLAEPSITLEEMVALIAAFIADLDLGPVTLVGNCMGSNIAVKVSRAHPELVTGVLAVNPLTDASFSGGKIGFVHRMKHLAVGPTRAMRSASRHFPIPKFAGSTTLRFQLGSKGVAKGLQHDEELLACQFRPEQMPALVDVLNNMDAYGELDTVDRADTMPIWVAWGTQNKVLSRKRAAGLEDHLHAERVELIEGTGHLPMLEDPVAVTALIEELIATTANVAEATVGKASIGQAP